MKALTLTQPWATLVAIGAKKIETRSWNTSYRGPLAIHAAKGFPVQAKDFSIMSPCYEVLQGFGFTRIPDELPLGAVIATCTLVDVHRIDRYDFRPGQRGWEIERHFWEATEQEKAFGDYSIDRYMWFLSDVVILPEPIPAKGALSLWEWDGPINEVIR